MLVTANPPLGERERIFPKGATALALLRPPLQDSQDKRELRRRDAKSANANPGHPRPRTTSSLALRRFPHTFPLLQRFWITGVADYAHAEMIYEALVDAGFARDELVPICFGWYAAVLGLASAEAGGLLTPAGPEQLAEVGALDREAFPITTGLLGECECQTRDTACDCAVAILLDGLEAQCAAQDSGLV